MYQHLGYWCQKELLDPVNDLCLCAQIKSLNITLKTLGIQHRYCSENKFFKKMFKSPRKKKEL